MIKQADKLLPSNTLNFMTEKPRLNPAVIVSIQPKAASAFLSKKQSKQTSTRPEPCSLFIFICFVLLTAILWIPWPLETPSSRFLHTHCPQLPERIPALHPKLDEPLKSVFRDPHFRHQVALHLSEAIQIKTVSYDDSWEGGPDRYQGFIDFHAYLERSFPLVHRHLKRHVIANYSLVYLWNLQSFAENSTRKPLMLCSHIDTVPVPESTLSQWKRDPFSGYIDDDYVWGRGASGKLKMSLRILWKDTKSTLIEIMESVEMLLEQGFGIDIPMLRPVILAFGHEEETSGLEGAAAIADFLSNNLQLQDGIEMIIDEGPGLQFEYGEQFAHIGTTEKGYVDMTISLETQGGHASVPPPRTGAGLLSELIYRIESETYTPALLDTSPFLQSLYCRALHVRDETHADPYLKWALLHLDDAREELIQKLRSTSRVMQYMMETSQAVDVMSSGVKVNALPELSIAKMNHRVAHHQTVSTVEKHLMAIMEPFARQYNMSFVFSNQDTETVIVNQSHATSRLSLITKTDRLMPAPISPMFGDGVFDLLSGTLRAVFNSNSSSSIVKHLPRANVPHTHVIVTPSIMLGNTDTRHYWNLSRHIYRFSPHREGYSVGRYGVHTVNERNWINSLVEGVVFYYQLIRNFNE